MYQHYNNNNSLKEPVATISLREYDKLKKSHEALMKSKKTGMPVFFMPTSNMWGYNGESYVTFANVGEFEGKIKSIQEQWAKIQENIHQYQTRALIEAQHSIDFENGIKRSLWYKIFKPFFNIKTKKAI